MKAVYRHELHSYFTTPVGYIFLIMYTFLAGVVYVFVNIADQSSASMNLLFSGMQLPFMLLAPLITMRLFAEERRMRTDQLIFTAPVRVSAVVLGKALAAFTLMGLAMALTLLFPLAVSPWAQLSLRQVLTVWLGYFLLGMAMLSVGVWISALCLNQVSAAVLTLGVNLVLYLAEHYILPQMSAGYLAPVRALLAWLPSAARLSGFSNGVIGLADVIYFLTFAALMLFFTDRAIMHRRYAKG